jgi:50S ribosomal protein L16 3-hydroxylase
MPVPAVLDRLGPLGVRRFMREYWQRRPALLAGAFAGLAAPVSRARLFALAGREDVEARLVVRTGSRWALRTGPFAQGELPPLSRPGWTLLVQGVDGLEPRAHALLARFRFVPDARLDDLMVSYATDGGGVGPHADNYDVFLLQVQGRRRWRISGQRRVALRAGQPLPLLAGFRPSREWMLGPGDVLYLPPGVPHEGTAVGECITCSIGFRAPTWAELLDPWFAAFAERARLPGRYTDAGDPPAARPAVLPEAMVRRVHTALARARPTRADTARFLLEHLSEPKPGVVFARPGAGMRAAFGRAVRRAGVVLDLRTRVLCGRAGIGINGEWLRPPGGAAQALRRLADRRSLAPHELARLDRAALALLRDWHAAGWLHLAPVE